MAEYLNKELGFRDALMVRPSDERPALAFGVEGGRTAYLSGDQLRALQQQIAEHLGDAEKLLLVGTIVVGKGLTEAQKRKAGAPNDDHVIKIREARDAVLSMDAWNDTVEGHAFWHEIHARLNEMLGAYSAEKLRQEEAKRTAPFKVFGITVDEDVFSDENKVVTVELGNTKQMLGVTHARELAQALLRHADAAEKSG